MLTKQESKVILIYVLLLTLFILCVIEMRVAWDKWYFRNVVGASNNRFEEIENRLQALENNVLKDKKKKK